MKVTIHRGNQQIGGTCIELNDGKTRLVLDVGSPLDADLGDGSLEAIKPFLPKVKGLFKDDCTCSVDAVFISHSHPDHAAFLNQLKDNTHVIMSKTTKLLTDTLNIFLGRAGELGGLYIETIDGWHGHNQAVTVGDFEVTAYDVDHSVPGALAFLIKHTKENKTILYTGDIRAHGRKHKLFDSLINECRKKTDFMLMEGTMVGNQREGGERSEDDLKLAVAEQLKKEGKPVLVNFSMTNVDRTIGLVNACVMSGYEFVIDLPNALVYERLREQGWNIPPISDLPFKIFYLKAHMRALKENGVFEYAERLRPLEIRIEDIFKQNNRLVLFRESHLKYFKDYVPEGLTLMMSKWWGKPYPGQEEAYERYMAFIKEKNLQMDEHAWHVSGHAYVSDLQALVTGIKPKEIIPVHTEHPEVFAQTFMGNTIHRFDDGVPEEI